MATTSSLEQKNARASAVRLRRTFADFFSPETIVPFLIGSFALSIAGNAAYDYVLTFTGQSRSSFAVVAGMALAVLGLAATLVAWLVRHRREIDVDPPGLPPEASKGLIVLITREEPCRMALQPHLGTLQHLWLICSRQTEAAAEAIRREFAPQIAAIHEPIVVNDLYSPRPTMDAVRTILPQLPAGLSPADVACDYTGLTAHCSVGMVLAALNADAPLQSVPARLDETLKVIGSRPAIKVRLRLARQRS